MEMLNSYRQYTTGKGHRSVRYNMSDTVCRYDTGVSDTSLAVAVLVRMNSLLRYI